MHATVWSGPSRRETLFTRLAASVKPGGTLLIVGRHPSDLRTTIGRPPIPELLLTAEEASAGLAPAGRTSSSPTPDPGPPSISQAIHDAVPQARKRP